MAERILIVDDELDLREILQCNLENAGFEADTAASAEEALTLLTPAHSMILLDVMMGGMSGFDFARMLRQELNNQIPIIFLTARDTEADLLRGFSVGGDDFITKPFSLQEVLARVRAVLRRQGQTYKSRKTTDEAPLLTIDEEKKLVYNQELKVELSRKEYDILRLLSEHPGRVFSREEIIQHVWDTNIVVLERTVDVHITRLRKKLGAILGGRIVNRQGYGYCYLSDEA
ncbi:MAG: response regulator transcription factor [Bacteroidaceae bacterium]|nr:response regulator transcription factor [Bacteroidaceae bacterium]